jgi:serine/threonine-protein kinase
MGTATDQWHLVDELFKAALDLPAAERKEFVRRSTCDSEIKSEVLSLIDASDTSETILESEAGALSGPLWTEFARTLVDDDDGQSTIGPGSAVGQYTITREIGRGGMAVVYEAERKFGPLKQRFALKVVKRGADTDEVIERFGVERQILATLNHPNIARLHDGGVTSDGRPYFVMELVDGTPIVDYAREFDLSIGERLRLFAEVCGAVQYAHRNLVVHRDLKPSNILVTRDGQPKLLDFGIAKVIQQDSTLDQVKTRTGSFWLTPDYASPEQVRGLTVTTSSDVYGLGVVLYELLTGRRPFVFTRRDPLELRRMICETNPERPSTVVHREVPGENTSRRLFSFADRRAWSPDRVSRQLRGDLDTIVLKSLRKEPERRYESAEAMVADIRRYLGGRPVRATPDSTTYRFRKFVRRNARSLAVVGIVAVLSVGSVWYHTTRMRQQRDIAQTQAMKSQQVASFMSELLGGLRPNEFGGGNVRVEEILRQGLDKVDRELAQHPDVQAQLFQLIGEIYDDYGRYDEALRALRRAVALNDETFGDRSPESSRTLALLGWTERKRGDDELGERHLIDALEIQQSTPGMQDDVAATLTSLAWIYHGNDQLQRSLETFETALEMRKGLFGDRDIRVAESYGNIAFNLRTQGRLDEAEKFYRDALRIARNLYTEHTELAGALHGLGTLLMLKGELAEAEPYILDALGMRRRLFGQEHPQVAESLANLGMLYQDQGRYEESEVMLKESLSMSQALFPIEHTTIANGMNQLGWLYYRTQQYEKAEPLMVEAVRQYRVVSGDQHSSVASALNKLGLIQTELRYFDRAERSFTEAVEIRAELFGASNNLVEITRTNLGDMYIAWDSPTRADSIFRQVLDSRVQTMPARHYRIGQAHRDLGMALTRQRRFDEAEQHLIEGFDILRTELGIEDEYTQNAIRRLVELYQLQGRSRRARTYEDLLVNDPRPARR